MSGRRDLFRDEEGLTTVSMAVSIFLALALLFGAAQLYRVSSAAADIQEVADAAALAAEEEVSGYMSIANGCDGVLFTMTLGSTVLIGVGVVAACIPPAATTAQKLISMGRKVAEARDKAAESMASGLNALQKALPFITAARAAEVCERNQMAAMESHYTGAALLLPAAGEQISVSGDGLSDLVDRAESDVPAIIEQASQAEELAKQVDESKLSAWKADCGDAPGRCMQERAGSLAGIDGSLNPHHDSPDTWSFHVALDRARQYYRARSANEHAFDNAGLSCEERADSALRKRFYDWASDRMAEAWAASDERCLLPGLFRNLDGMRDTSLYTDQIFPVTVDGGVSSMHAWEGCPKATGFARRGSVAELERGGFVVCSECELTPSTFGNVASASTSTENGFEHYYRIVQEACERYNEAMDQLEPVKGQVQGSANSLFQAIGDVLGSAGTKRIHAKPPGWAGAMAAVVNTAQNPVDVGFENPFSGNGSTLGVRAAVSGATLQLDEEMPDTRVVDGLVDGMGATIPGADAPARIASDMWLGLLRAWNGSAEAITEVLEGGTGELHTTTASGLGKWASDALTGLMEGLGLEPPQLYLLRPVLVNTKHPAQADGSSLSVKYLQMKQGALAASSGSTDLFSALSAGIGEAVKDTTAGTVEVVQVSLPLGDIEIPITIALPTSIQEGAHGLVVACMDSLAGVAASVSGVRSWQ